MNQSRVRFFVFIGALLLGLTVAVLTQTDRGTPNDPYVPSEWSLVSREGRIASLCMGSWQECGQIKSRYDVTRPEASIGELANKLESAGWLVESEGGSSLSALRDDEDARISARLEGSHVEVIYVER
jgi:hypothetical protein